MNQGEKILVLIKQRGLTYEKVAQLSGLGLRTIERAVHNTGTTRRTIEKLCTALNVTPDALSGDDLAETSMLRKHTDLQTKYIATLEAENAILKQRIQELETRQ